MYFPVQSHSCGIYEKHKRDRHMHAKRTCRELPYMTLGWNLAVTTCRYLGRYTYDMTCIIYRAGAYGYTRAMYVRYVGFYITLPYLTNLRYSSFINHVRYLRLGTGMSR